MIKRIAPIALLLALGAAATGCSLNGAGKSATATTSTTATGAAPWYAPYVDASLTMPKSPSRQVVLSFITGNGCTPTWNSTPLAQATAINTRIQQTQALNNQVIVSFGGETGPELATSCTDPTQLEAAYHTVVSRYNLSTIDLDIEGRVARSDRQRPSRAGHRRAAARAGDGRQAAGRLADAGSDAFRPAADSLAAVQQMIAAGVTVSGVNVMAFDYGPLGGHTVLSASESALRNTATQVQSLGLTPGPSWARPSWPATPTRPARRGRSPMPRRSTALRSHTVSDACPCGRSTAISSVYVRNRNQATPARG